MQIGTCLARPNEKDDDSEPAQYFLSSKKVWFRNAVFEFQNRYDLGLLEEIAGVRMCF